MRVLYFHQHFRTPETGGGTRSYEFSKRLLQKGHKVTMVCGANENFDLVPTKIKNIKRGDVEGIDVIQIDLPYSNYDSIAKRAKTFIKYAYTGIKIALKEEYDLLFATSTPLTAGIPGIFMKLFGKKKRKFVFEVRDLWPELPKALGMKNPVLLAGMNILEKLSYRKADACIGLSPGICEGIKRRAQSHKEITMIPNGSDIDIFYSGDREDLNLEGIKLTDKVAVFTGAHGIANGLDAVLDAASILKSKGREDIVFAFIGDGKLKPELMRRAKDETLTNCRFYDPMPKKELKEIMASADIGLMILKDIPAFYYGTSPNKFFDYIAAGLPVLNNYPGWLADMIKEYEFGEVVSPNNPKGFAEAMIKLADSPELREGYGENARALAERKFARDILAEQFVSFLEGVYENKE